MKYNLSHIKTVKLAESGVTVPVQVFEGFVINAKIIGVDSKKSAQLIREFSERRKEIDQSDTAAIRKLDAEFISEHVVEWDFKDAEGAVVPPDAEVFQSLAEEAPYVLEAFDRQIYNRRNFISLEKKKS